MWLITHDYIYDSSIEEDSCIGIHSSDYDTCTELPYEFLMLIDDEWAYAGLSDEISTDPCDNWGLPYAGCNKIQYKIGREWEVI